MDSRSNVIMLRSPEQQQRIERANQRKERERRVALKLSMPTCEVPSALRGLIENSFGAMLDNPGLPDHLGLASASYLFPNRDDLQTCQRLCSQVIRRSVVPVEMQDRVPLWGGAWFRDLAVPLGTQGRYEAGGWWFANRDDYEQAKSIIQGGRPNDGRGAYRDTPGRYLLFAQYVPRLVRRDEMFGAKRIKEPKPAWSFQTSAHLEQALEYCRAVIPLSEIPRSRSPSLLEVGMRTGGNENWPTMEPPLICLSEEIGGLHFFNPNDLAEMRARLRAEGEANGPAICAR